MQSIKALVYQCYTCNKQFPCKPSLDRHSIGHDLEEFASWTKTNNAGTPDNSHIPPHKKLVLEPEAIEMNGNYGNSGQVYIKTEVQKPEPCAYQHSNPRPQYVSDLMITQKPAGPQHSMGPMDHPSSPGTHAVPESTQTEQETSSVGTKGHSTKKGNQTPRRPRSPSQIRVKSFFCDQCERSYMRRDHLNRHKLIHTGEKQFVCSFCLKSFFRKDKLQRHEKIHSKDPQFDCQICGKGFGRKDALNKHYLAHKMGTVGNKDPKMGTVEIREQKEPFQPHPITE